MKESNWFQLIWASCAIMSLSKVHPLYLRYAVLVLDPSMVLYDVKSSKYWNMGISLFFIWGFPLSESNFLVKSNHHQIKSNVFLVKSNHHQIKSVIFLVKSNHHHIKSTLFLVKSNHKQIKSAVLLIKSWIQVVCPNQGCLLV